MNMRALVYHSPTELRIEDVQRPAVGDSDVLIRVQYCGICGTDIHIYNGEGGSYEVTPPLIMGHEFSGIVEQVGKNVQSIGVGDQVTVNPNDMCGHCHYCQNAAEQFCEHAIGYGTTRDGGFAQYCVVSEKQVFKFNNDIDLLTASMAEPLSCCIHGIDLCHVQVGDDVLIIGGGPIGLIMLQLARMAGANRVVLSEPISEKRELAKQLGASATIDPLADDVEAQLQQHCPYPSVVIECVGNVRTIQNAIDWAGKGATVMMYGLTGPDAEIAVRPDIIFKKEIKLTSSFINPYTFERAVRILDAGTLRLRELISDVIPLKNAVDAFSNQEYRRKGKVVIQLND